MRSLRAGSAGGLLLSALQLSASALPQQITKPASTARGPGLTNSDVVRMVNAKFDDPTIVKTIEANEQGIVVYRGGTV